MLFTFKSQRIHSHGSPWELSPSTPQKHQMRSSGTRQKQKLASAMNPQVQGPYIQHPLNQVSLAVISRGQKAQVYFTLVSLLILPSERSSRSGQCQLTESLKNFWKSRVKCIEERQVCLFPFLFGSIKMHDINFLVIAPMKQHSDQETAEYVGNSCLAGEKH